MSVNIKDGVVTVTKEIEEDDKENISPTTPRAQLRWDRSPHPYHRRQSSHTNSRIRSGQSLNSNHSQLKTVLPDQRGHSRDRLLEANHVPLRRTVSSSDSGTEADDEGGVLRGLPAPPMKRKSSSPLLTPRTMEDESRKLCLEHNTKQEGNRLIFDLGDEDTRKIRNKFTRRRRMEYLRRLLETVLLLSVGFIACGKRHEHFSHMLKRELAGYTCVSLGIYLLYLSRLFYRSYQTSVQVQFRTNFLGIPPAFDPAPLLYPTLLPIFVAISLKPFNSRIVLANLLLSLAAIPYHLIPFGRLCGGYNILHWFLTAIPLLIARQRGSKYASNSLSSDSLLRDQIDAENLLLLYPLHQALLPTLGYLTTTSLLPAELQLLSISMINLLLFSTSAQATILKALLWIGGLLMFACCDRILRRAVALARIPSWRFRNSHRLTRGRNIFWVAIEDYFQGRLGQYNLMSMVHESSASDDCIFSGSDTSQNSRLERLPRENWGRKNALQESGRKPPMVAANKIKGDDLVRSPNSSDPSVAQKRRHRRHTLLSYVGSPHAGSLLRRTSLLPFSRPTRSRSRSRALLSLTYAQAIVLKWCYAAYVYLVTLFIILIPVRIAVSRWALLRHEPVGWALGYLFGDVPIFRTILLDLHLESWVYLPGPIAPDLFSETSRWNKILSHFGAANVRLLICLYCLIIIAVGLCVVLSLTPFVAVDTRRKVFHGMMVVMFLPSILIDPAFAALALSLTLAIFLLLDLFRASQLPPLSKPLTHFLAPYVDGRDHRGPVIVSHIFLLIGCAIPLWLSLAVVDRADHPPWHGWEVPTRDVSMVSGVICVGMGDAAASLFGRRFGRRRWLWGGGKSLEGSLAFAVAVVLGLSLAKRGIRLGGWNAGSSSRDDWMTTLLKSTVAASGASLTETVLTGGNDNVIVPVVLWLLVQGLAI